MKKWEKWIMWKNSFVALIVVICFVTAVPVPVSAYTTQNYNWDNVRIGGGGSVPGIVLHPQVADLAYIRTDVGAMYRWENTTQTWVPLTEWATLFEGDGRLYGVEAIAVDPSDTTGNTVYASIGKAAYSFSPLGEVIKSTDRGQTWTRTGHRTSTAANWDQEYGERLAVDPNNGNVIYHASREGLYRSTNGGVTWALTNAPTGDISKATHNDNVPSGILFVAIDPRTTTGTPALSSTIYIGAYNDGIYKSTDGGATYQKLTGGPSLFYRAEIDANGKLYVTGNGLWKYSGSSWANISPEAGINYMGFAVDPNNSNHLIVSKHDSVHNLPMWRSTNGGSTWTLMDMYKNLTTSWMPSWHWRSSTFDIAIDPFNSGRVWFTDWYTPWRTDNIEATTTSWTDYNTGIEEIVTTGGLVSPPSGNVKLLSGMADNGGFAHTSLSDKPASGFWQSGVAIGHNGTGVDFQESNPTFVALSTMEGWNGNGYLYYSVDQGLNFTQAANVPVTNAKGGRVAVSANSERILWTVAGQGTYYTTNRGTSWTASSGLPNALVNNNGLFTFNQPLVSDRVNGNKFYAYKDGTFYRSTNGGANFSATVTNLPNNWWHSIQSAPGVEGEVWAALDGNGLYRSSNSGTSFAKLSNVQRAYLFSFGKGINATTPAVYVYGKVDNVEGIFRSDDLGSNWVKIDVPSPTAGNEPNIMAGDRQVYGRVYIGTNGTGIYYGEPATTPPVPDTQAPTAPSNLAAGAVTDNSVTLTWNASSDNIAVTGYDVYRGGVKVNVSAIAGTSYTDSGLTSATAYIYTVKAKDAALNESAASAQLSVTTTTTPIPPSGPIAASKTVTIDGQLNESLWNLTNTIASPTFGNSDNTGTFDVRWDNQYLYVAAKVLDANLYFDSAAVYQNDSVEIYIDANHNAGTTYDTYDRQYILGYNNTQLTEKNGRTTGVLHGVSPLAGGYAVEIAIPWSNLAVTPGTGTTIGFDIGFNDDDNGGDRESQSVWNGNVDNWTNTSAFGDFTLSAANKTISVDGNPTESSWNLNNAITKSVIGVSDNNATFGITWDNQFLYVAAKVFDANLHSDSAAVYQNDSVEIYIDANHNAGTTYDTYDRQFILGYNNTQLMEKNGRTTGVLHGVSVIAGGYAVEIAIPWSNLAVTPGAGTIIGFDIGFNDDDNGGDRESQSVWSGTADNWSNTSGFGDLVLNP